MARIFSQEDGNLSVKPITTSRTKSYVDIDLTFANKPSGDVYKKTDAESVKQGIKNLLLTNHNEKPFQPYYGGDLNRFLFELSEDLDEEDIEDRIASAIVGYEPRALLRRVKVTLQPDNNLIQCEIKFQVISTLEEVTQNITLTRLR